MHREGRGGGNMRKGVFVSARLVTSSSLSPLFNRVQLSFW
jgi:hypothetical protein